MKIANKRGQSSSELEGMSGKSNLRDKEMKHFLLKTSILLFLFIITGFFIYYLIIPQFYTYGYLLSLFIVFIITNIVHAYMLNILNKNDHKFTSSFLATKILRLVIYLIFIALWVFVIKEQPVLFLVNFLVIYIAFTVMDTHDISRVAKHN